LANGSFAYNVKELESLLLLGPFSKDCKHYKRVMFGSVVELVLSFKVEVRKAHCRHKGN